MPPLVRAVVALLAIAAAAMRGAAPPCADAVGAALTTAAGNSAVTDSLTTPATLPRRPSVGAIRWDAWNRFKDGSYDNVSGAAHKCLSPHQWHPRLPFFGAVTGNNSVTFNENSQAVMDQEIRYAVRAGLQYWAFDTYCSYPGDTHIPECQAYFDQWDGYRPRDPAYGLDLYLASKRRAEIGFTLILLGAPAAAPAFVNSTVSLMLEPGFHHITDAAGESRPLLYAFQLLESQAAAVGGWPAWKARFQALRNASIAAGAGNPYLVAMSGSVQEAATLRQQLGFDAVSAYAIASGSTLNGAPYAAQVASAQKWWKDAQAMGLQLVPQAPTGWDPRPRAENEPSWTHEGPNHFVAPTSDELSGFVRSATQWACAHQHNGSEALSVLMYAWQECSEGGYLIPTVDTSAPDGVNTQRIDALSAVLPAAPCA